MALLDDALGTLLIGSWLNVMLFAIEVSQLWKYVKRVQRDVLPIRLLLAVMVAIDFTATTNACAMVYLYCVSNWGNPAFMAQQNATIPVYSITTGVSTLLMHGFLIWRYFKMPKASWKTRTVVPLLLCGALTAFIGDMLSSWSVIHFTALADRPKLTHFATIWLTSSAGTDFCIATALIWELKHMTTQFQSTKSLIQRVINRTIVTGAATAILALLALTTFFAQPSSNLCLTFGFCIGRACTLTVIYNLNTRGEQSSSEAHVVALNSPSCYKAPSSPLRVDVETAVTHDYGTYSMGVSGKEHQQDTV